MASTNARPLKSTARPAVAPEPAIASSSDRFRRALLAVARDEEEAVVGGDRETHDRGHLEQEHGEVQNLAEEGREPEGDGDREERDDEGDNGRDDRPEDEHEDDERPGGRSTARRS